MARDGLGDLRVVTPPSYRAGFNSEEAFRGLCSQPGAHEVLANVRMASTNFESTRSTRRLR